MIKRIKGVAGGLAYKGVIACGTQILSTGGGIEVISAPDVLLGDVVLVTLISDDTGTPITKILGVADRGKITITRTDDGSSADDAVVQFLVIRPE